MDGEKSLSEVNKTSTSPGVLVKLEDLLRDYNSTEESTSAIRELFYTCTHVTQP